MQPDTLTLPAEKTSLQNWFLLTSLYITQYLPLGFFFVALIAILRQQGTPLEQLSLIYFIGMFWVFKFLWAPLVDKFNFGRIGHYRGWLLLMQISVVITLYGLSQLNIADDFEFIFLLCMLIGLLSATQDVAADALVYRLVPGHERGIGNSIQIGGAMIGNLFGAGAILMLYPTIGWEGCVYLLMIGVLLSIVLLLRFKEPKFTFEHPSIGQSMKRLATFWKRPKGAHWFAILMVYPLGVSLAYGLITPMLVDAKWGLDSIGFVVNVIGSAVGILGAVSAGWLIKRYGRKNTIRLTVLFQLPGILLLLLVTQGFTDQVTVALVIAAYFLGYTPVSAVLYTLMMDHSSDDSPATDFALQYSIYSAVGFIAAGLATALAGQVGYMPIVLLAASTVFVAAYVTFKYPFKEY
ncbi:MFS transporter [Thiomicrorhabdus sp.]|uniref:MFS transporter n=1 Tax=Thiomicrorhabdus sp. TaxID=2039724 RepID=UPI0029C893C4|nr:MFS transporter [Thiomicrorhabdus sp.]